ncbi:MAG: pimeloyl-ACP methyl ester carboxylesterase [Candidatus Poriferisodalaceae bacterium]
MSAITALGGLLPRKYLQTDGLATLVHHRGAATLPGQGPDTSNGTTIVMLHDAGSNGNEFGALMDALDGDHSPVSFDQPGHGRSGGLDSLGSVAAMADHAASVLGAWGLTDVVLVGEGMGAAVGLELAGRPSSPVVAVVAVGAAGLTFDLDDEIAQLAAITSGKARRQFDQTGFAPDADSAVFTTSFQEWVKTDPRATVNDRRGQAAWDGAAAAAAVVCPVVVIVGEHQDAGERSAAEAVAEACSSGRVAELPGAARHGIIEQPVGLAALVNEVVAGLELSA